jgi:hypothetical protein
LAARPVRALTLAPRATVKFVHMHSIANFPERRPDQGHSFLQKSRLTERGYSGLLLKRVLISDGSRSLVTVVTLVTHFNPLAGSRAGPTATGPIADCSRATTETFTAAIIFLIGCALRTAFSSHERGMLGMQLLRAGPAKKSWPALLQSPFVMHVYEK